MKKIIAIDCFKLVKGEGASIGIYNYTKNLAENLASLAIFEIYIFGNKYNKVDFDISGVVFIDINIRYRNKLTYLFWELLLVNKYIYRYNIKLIIFPRGYIPLFSFSKTINIVHDFIPMYYYKHYKDQINYIENFYIRHRLLSSIKHSDKTITISKYSKKEIMQYLQDYNSISVIYNGYNRLTNVKQPVKTSEYIVAVSSDKYKHKNLSNIIKTYIIYHEKVKNPMKLHLLGVRTLSLLKIDVPKTILSDIVLYNFVPDDEYIQIVQNAKVFLFLSLIEGFGFPPLEAMNLGVPVICSRNTSLAEVVADAGILVDSHNLDYIVDQIIKIHKDKLYRDKLINKGYKNLERFNWKKIIHEYVIEIKKQLEP